MPHALRKAQRSDLDALRQVLTTIDLFPATLLDGMMADYLDNPDSQDYWFTAVSDDDKPIAFGYCAPEQLTNGTYNLLAIGVSKELQGQGIGKRLMTYIEQQLTDAGRRILIVETSGADAFAATRKFYEDLGYAKEAVIRDFWDAGDDKVVYWKRL